MPRPSSHTYAPAPIDVPYRSLVEQVPAIVYIADFQGIRPFLYVSPQAEEILGYPPEEWVADPDLWNRLLHPDDGVATTDIWLRHSHDGAATWEPEQHLHGPFDQYDAPISFFAPGDPRGLFLGDYMGLETIEGNDVINFFTSTISDGADVHALRANHP